MKIAHLNSSCIDKSNGRKVRKKMCGPRHTRPKGRRRSCNTFSCDFEWASDRWEPCTRSCGSQGLRQRQVYCVPLQNNQTQDVQLWRQMVDPRKCPGDRPKRISECNRVPCPAKWIAIGTIHLCKIPPECGNSKIFPSFRFYVKSVLENLKILKRPFLRFLGL